MKEKETHFSVWKYLKQYKVALTVYILLSLLASAASIAITIFAANAVEYVTNKMWDWAMYALVAVLVMIAVQRFCWWELSILYYKTSAKFTLNLNSDLARQAFKLNSKTYTDHSTGTFVQRIVDDPSRLLENLSQVVDSLSDIITAVAVFVYVATLNIYLALLLVALLLSASVIEVIRSKVRRKNRALTKKAGDKVYSLTTEIVRSEKDIKSMGLEESLKQEAYNCYKEYQTINCKTEVSDTNKWCLRNFIVDFGTYAILILGIVFIRKELISLATYMIIYSNRSSLFSVVWGFGRMSDLFSEIKVSSQRMSELFDEVEFVTERFGTVEFDALQNAGGGSVKFDNVSYSYKQSEYKRDKQKRAQPKKLKIDKGENKIFENLSFEIKPNTTVAFVGKSGSGKSTILNLISKMSEVDGGQILINGININDLSKDALRSTISLVNQFPYIFDMTIRDNLLLVKKDATQEQLDKAIKDANLDEFVASLPKGLDTKVGESGIKLSGGQRQRLAIARALLRDSNIIIFDESTSSLDNFSQQEIKKSVDALKGKSTIVIVAHRLSTIKDVDHIFFLDQGKIVDEGTFEQLFERNKTFKALFLAENT